MFTVQELTNLNYFLNNGKFSVNPSEASELVRITIKINDEIIKLQSPKEEIVETTE